MRLTKHQARIVAAAAEIAQSPDQAEPAFLARQFVAVTLPHADPGNVPSWWRRNGDVTLTIAPGYDAGRCVGYPYGTIPRLLLFWISREVIRTENPRLTLGDSLSEFMRELGLNPATGGGRRSDARRLRDQMNRLFRSRISFHQVKNSGRGHGQSWLDMQIAPAGTLWWDEREPDQPPVFESWIQLDQQFFEAIRTAPVPVDMRALRALKRSPLALDLYAWACHAAFVATRTGRARFVAWEQLMQQLGADYSDLHNFRAKAKRAFRKIVSVYPGLRVGGAMGGVEILPGASAVPAKPPRRKRAP